MSVTSSIIVQDPVDTDELFVAARQAVGLPDGGEWYLLTGGPGHMLQTRPDQGAAAQVTVHFMPGGGRYPGDNEGDQPDGDELWVAGHLLRPVTPR